MAHDLNILVTNPEVQELLKKAAERRAISIHGTSLGRHTAKPHVRQHAGAESAFGTNGRLQFSPSVPLLGPLKAVDSADPGIPSHCLASSGRPGAGLSLENTPNCKENASTTSVVSGSGNSECWVQTQEWASIGDGNSESNTSETDSAIPLESKELAMSDSSFIDETQPDDSANIRSEKSEMKPIDEDTEPPHEPLSFQIPEDALRQAMLATPDSAASFYSQSLYRGPEDQQLAIHYCHTPEIAKRVLPYFLEEKVLGFDIEWKPHPNPRSIKENASLIQIASEDRIALFHISLYPGTKPEELVPDDLRTIIESPDIYKVGVAIKGDFTRLAKYLGVKPQGVFELSRLHNLVENYGQDDKLAASRKLCALATQVKQHLFLPLYKGEVRESDWTTRLKNDQLAYAATDAYASLRLYDALEAKRKALQPIPPRPAVCDYDSAPRPSAARLKPARMDAIAPKEEQAESFKPPEESDEEAESSAYETASEDIVDSQELEDAPNTTLSPPSAHKSTDPDAKQTPPSVDEAQVQDLPGISPQDPQQTRRVGRVRLGTSQPLVYPSSPSWKRARTCPEHQDTTKRPASHLGPFVPEQNDVALPGRAQAPPDSQLSIRSETRFLQVDGFSPVLDLTPMRADNSELSTHHCAQLKMLPSSQDDYQPSSNDLSLVRPNLSPDKHPIRLSKVTEGSTQRGRQAGKLQSKNTDLTSPSEHFVVGPATRGANAPPHLASAPRPTLKTPTPSTTLSTGSAPVPVAATLSTDISKPDEVIAAEAWAQAYLLDSIPSATVPPTAAQSRIRATMSHLRAYHLWHRQNLDVGAISGLLRQPPLAESTVASYILQAVSLEKLPYRKEDMRNVLAVMPYTVRMARWGWMVQNVG